MANLTNGAGTTFFGIRKTSGSLDALYIGPKTGTQYEVLSSSAGAVELKNIQFLSSSNSQLGAMTGSTLGATAVTATSLNLQTGGITNAGSIAGATTITTSGDVTVGGNLIVDGTTTTVNSTTITVDDKNIELGSVDTPTDVTADGGGITLRGATNHTILWTNSTDSWDFSEHVNAASGKEFRIDGTSVLNATTLGGAVVNSSLTSVGALDGGSITSGFGSIDIGTSTLNAGASTFTTITSSAAATLASLTSVSVNIDGGAIDGTAIGASTRSTGAFTTLSGSGAAEFASMHSDSVNIDGGAIDGTAIGANSASTGAFTALSASTALVMDGVSLTAVVTETEGIGSNDNDTSFPTSAAVKDYVDSVASSGFTLSDDSGNEETIGNGNTLIVSGTANEVNVAVSATDTLTIGLPDDVTLAGDLTVSGGDIDLGTSTGRIQLDGTTVLTLSGSDVTAAGSLTVSNGLTADDTLSVAQTATFDSDISVGGTATFNGNVELGDADTDTITVYSRFASSLVPSETSVSSLGSASLQWANIHADAGNIDSITATSVTDGTATLTGGALTGLTTLGSEGTPVSNLYATNVITGDFHMKNERGDWTLFEESDHIRIRNNATGQVFKMGMTLIEE